MQDQRSRRAIEVAERYADGLASPQDVRAAQGDAEHAVRALHADWPHLCRRWRETTGSGPNAAGGAVNPDCALAAALAAMHATAPTLYDPAEEVPERSSLYSLLDDVGEAPGDGWKPLGGRLRDIVGNPFRPVSVEPSWRASPVLDLARSIYDERAFDRLPILADALEDAGCTNADILGHCRGGGDHVRGCWVVDLVLGKQ
jgi:hypothetical protein